MHCQLEPNFNFHPPKYHLSYPDIHPFTDPLQWRHSLIVILTLTLISNLNWIFFFLNWILNLTLDLKFPSHDLVLETDSNDMTLTFLLS